MGTWDSSIFGNDIALDVKDVFLDLVKKNNYSEELLIAHFADLLGQSNSNNVQDITDFWLALAKIQWEYGLLSNLTLEKALDCLSKEKNPMWTDKNGKFDCGRKKTLDKSKILLLSNNPNPKKISTMKPGFITPLRTGNIYAIATADDTKKPAYLLFQVVGVRTVDSNNRIGNIFPVIKIISTLFYNISDFFMSKIIYPLPVLFTPSDIKDDGGINDDGNCYIRYTETLIDTSLRSYRDLIFVSNEELLFPKSIDEKGDGMIFIKDLGYVFSMMKSVWNDRDVKLAFQSLKDHGNY